MEYQPHDQLIVAQGTFRDEDDVIHNSDVNSLPGSVDQSVLGNRGSEPVNRNAADSVARSTESIRYSDNETAHEVRTYPPGVTVTGSSNLPIPEIDSDPDVRDPRKRRRRKRKKIQPSPEGELEQHKNQALRPMSEGEYLQKALDRPEYTQPAPRALPPIKAKTAAFTASTAAVIGPVLPEVDKSDRPEPMSAELTSFPNTENASYGATNDAERCQDETGFVSNPDAAAKDQLNGKSKENNDKQFYKRPKATLYFHDGVRYIDYVVAYEEEEESTENDQMRQTFEEGLEKKGLQLEREPKESSQDQKTCFVKIHIPWETRLKYAERMKMKMPLKEGKVEDDAEEKAGCCSCITNALNCCVRPCRLNDPEVREKLVQPDCYTAEFQQDKLYFFDMKDEESFFSHSERSRMAHRIMSETRYGNKRLQIGINQLISEGIYTTAFPLHEGKFANKEHKMATDANMRRTLYWEWARWGRWYKFQPLDLIRTYLSDKIALYFAFLEFYVIMLFFASAVGVIIIVYGCVMTFKSVTRQYLGDKIAIYFAWLGFYTKMLMYPTFVGFVVFIYSIATLWTYPPTQEVCDETYVTYAGNLTMCPLCDQQCTYWKLKTSCLAARITYVFDNESTIFFAVFMSLWATLFLEFWKRRQFELSYDWDLVDYDEERDLIRPEFEARVDRERLNPVTGQLEPYLATRDKYTRAALSLVTVFFWIIVIVAAVIAVIIYRLVINSIFAATVDLSSLGAIGSLATPSMLTTITASLLSLIIIMLLNKVYEKVAIFLTKMELPRTQIEFEDSFTLKMFCFQFVNYYSYLFYIAFFKSSVAGYPANYTYLFSEWRWEACDAGGCMYELSLQLIIIMFGKQLWNNIVELVWPWLINKYRQWKSAKATREMPDNEYTRWEQDYDLSPVREMDLFYEYLEMVIQFGFVTLFVSAFPLAPVLALINNIVEIRLDANKFICEYRRPLAQKCSDIGVWYYLLEFIGTLAVVTNAFTIAITSEAIPKMVYYYAYSVDTFNRQTLQGYTDNSLSIFNVSDFNARSLPDNPMPFPDENVTECRYKDYRSPPNTDPAAEYLLTMQYWHVFAARLAFIIAMEHVVFFLKRFLDYLVPDRPGRLKEMIKREHFLINDMLVKAEKEELRKQFSQDPGRSSASPTKSNMEFFSVENEKITTPM